MQYETPKPSGLGEYPAWVKLTSLPMRGSSRIAETFAIDPLFQDRAWSFIGDLAEKYPEQDWLLSTLGEQLIPRYPIDYPQGDVLSMPQRAFKYHKTPPWNMENGEIFKVLAAFPPTQEQYAMFRHFLFHPDLDVRWHSAENVLLNISRNGYSPKIVEDFQVLIAKDPDNLMKSWYHHHISHWHSQSISAWEMSIRGGVYEKPQVQSLMPKEDVLMFYGLGKYRNYRPNIAAENFRNDIDIDRIQKSIGFVQQKIGKMPHGEDEMDLSELQRNAEMEKHRFPSIYLMVPQLPRLPDKNRIEAVTNMLIRPHSFVTKEYINAYDLADIFKYAIRSVALIDNPQPRNAIIEALFSNSENNEVIYNDTFIKEAVRVVYMLPIHVIHEKVWPIMEKYQGNTDVTREFFRSVRTALIRDLGGTTLPRFGTKSFNY
jgi:hypothetical protein